MRKLLISILMMIVALMPGCSEAAAKHDDLNMVIYTSFYPMYFLANEIAGGRASVISIIPPGAEPHDWEPTPKLAIELSKSDMVIYNGAGMETWIDNILKIVDESKTKLVDASKGIDLLEPLEGGHGAFDPHVWVSPARAMQQAQNIYEALSEADPGNSEFYRDNKAKLDSKLAELDKDIRDASKLFKSNVIVVSHEAFGYFANDYGLRQIAIRGINPQEEPSPSKMAELVRECRDNNVRYVFFEQLTNPKLSETLAKEVGAGILILNDAAGLSREEIESGRDYITVMYENLDNLKKALGE